MQDTANRSLPRLGAPEMVGSENGSVQQPVLGRVVPVSNVAPHGRKGLWDALARAAAGVRDDTMRYPVDAALAVEPVCEEDVVDIEPRPHLAYLSRLAGIDEPETEVAPVVSLAEYRARRR